MLDILAVYKSLKKQYPNVDYSWWPTSGRFKPQRLETVIGALLTQNTNWRNVEKALENLVKAKKLTAKTISETSLPVLQKLIRPSGFYRQKSKRLRDLTKFIADFNGNFYKDVTREKLLSLHGIGRETADSILLYACNRPQFVIDAYTRRLLLREKIITGKEKYDELKDMFEKQLPKKVGLYKEFHALIVENEKNFKARRA